MACVHAQQVALKVFLYAQGEEIVLGHSVERLYTSAAAYDPAFGEKVKSWRVLDGTYVVARYPNSLPDSIAAKVFTSEAASRALELAGEAVVFLRQRLTGPRFWVPVDCGVAEAPGSTGLPLVA